MFFWENSETSIFSVLSSLNLKHYQQLTTIVRVFPSPATGIVTD